MKRAPQKFPGKVLLQTRVDAKLGEWVEREAAKVGLSVAAWLRVLVIQHRLRIKGS
jgi:hypothetical protein